MHFRITDKLYQKKSKSTDILQIRPEVLIAEETRTIKRTKLIYKLEIKESSSERYEAQGYKRRKILKTQETTN